MAIKLFFRNALARAHRNNFATQVSFLSSQALDRTCQLAANLERCAGRSGLPMPEDERKALYDEVNFQFGVLLDTICELLTVAAGQSET
jgi:hypothetical protein